MTKYRISFRYLLFLLFILAFQLNTFSQDAPFAWGHGIGGSGWDRAYDVTTDNEGNIYLTGVFGGTVDFDPSENTYSLSSHGGIDVFVIKMDAAGNFEWAAHMGGSDEDYGNAIQVDKDNNIYITGFFNGAADFDPGSGETILTSAGNKDIFITKLNSSGNHLWSHRIGGSSVDEANDLVLDDNSNVNITGRFVSTVDFNPGNGTHNLSAGSTPDIFILQLDKNGEFNWAHDIGAGDSDAGQTIAVDNDNNLVISGTFSGNVDFDPGSAEFNIYGAGWADVFISKYNSSGSFIWANSISGPGFITCQEIAIDSDGAVYSTGWFTESADFNPTGTAVNYNSVGAEDKFVTKHNPNGQLAWAKHIGGINLEWSYGIAVDKLGDVYTTGFFYDDVDFDPGAGTAVLSSASLEDAFILKLNTNGEFTWAKRIGGSWSETGYGIAIGLNDEVLIAGSMWETTDLDPGPDVFNVTSHGGSDIFVVKLSQTISNTAKISLPAPLVYPNPGTDKMTIQLENVLKEAIIRITDISGHQMLSQSIKNTDKVSLNLDQLNTGIYLITVLDDKAIRSVRWIKK
jgi:hypothetical protein